MIKLFVGIFLVSTISSKVYADCKNAYEVKANRRAEVIKDWKVAGKVSIGVTAGIGALALTGFVLIPAGGAALVGGVFLLPYGLAMDGILTSEGVHKTKKNNNNTFFKSLAAITAAKEKLLPKILLEKLDEKIGFYSLSDGDQAAVKNQVVRIINDGDKSEELCRSKGKIKPKTFSQLTDYILDNLDT